ncbi:MAG: hypothetical protein P8Z81_09220 [Deinococcales bacterium]
MLRSERSPAWHRDVKWVSAILLVVSLAVATLAFCLSQLTVRERAVPILRQMLDLTLLPEGGAAPSLAVRTGAAYQPGQKLTLLPGVEVFADPTEVPSFSVDQAVNRIAGVLAQNTIDGGAAAALGLVSDAGIQGQLRSALQGPVPELVTAGLDRSMLPSGLEDGSRIADWPKQAADNPGKPVQPIVGVFVYADPSSLATMTSRQIGEMVVAKLAADVLSDGMSATRQKVVNSNLRTRFDEALTSSVPQSLHAFYATLFLGYSDAIASRLSEAKAAIQGNQQKTESLQGLLPASQLAGLTPAQADVKVLDALASRSYQTGAASVVALMTRSDQKAKVSRVAPALDRFSAAAHRRYLAWTWIAGVLALIFLIVLLATSPGLIRLVYAGVAVAVSAAGGAWLFGRLVGLGTASAPPQAAMAQFGTLGGLASTVRYVVHALPADTWALPWRVYVIVLRARGRGWKPAREHEGGRGCLARSAEGV